MFKPKPEKAGNIIKQGLNQISSNISSGTIIDFEELYDKSIQTRVKSYIKSKIATNTTQSVFLDFKPKLFHETARDKYLDVVTSYKKQDKVELMKHLSVPLYDIFRQALKQTRPLPFTLYDEILDIKLVMARVYSQHKHQNNKALTWHQITCEFIYHDKLLKQDIKKYNVFERRQIDSSIPDSWRICHFD